MHSGCSLSPRQGLGRCAGGQRTQRIPRGLLRATGNEMVPFPPWLGDARQQRAGKSQLGNSRHGTLRWGGYCREPQQGHGGVSQAAGAWVSLLLPHPSGLIFTPACSPGGAAHFSSHHVRTAFAAAHVPVKVRNRLTRCWHRDVTRSSTEQHEAPQSPTA